MQKRAHVRKLCDTETPDDFERYYRFGIVGVVQPTGEVVPHQVNGHGDARNAFVLTTLAEPGKPSEAKVMSYRDMRNQISFACPDLGMVNVGATCAYTYSTGIRTAERGYRAARIGLIQWNAFSLPEKDRGLVHTAARELICNLYNKTFFSADEALRELEEGNRIGCAISDNTSLVTLPNCSVPLVAYRRNLVGFVDGGVKIYQPFAGARKFLSRDLGKEVAFA